MPENLEIVIGPDSIKNRVKEVARAIDARLLSDGVKSISIVWLREGAKYIAADILQNIATPCDVHSIKISSYGADGKPDKPRLIGDMCRIANSHVLLIDDILDTGATAKFAIDLLRHSGARKIYTCFLLDKDNGISKPVSADFVCFVVDNFFAVGYGLDSGGINRDLMGIFRKSENLKQDAK